MKKTKDLDLAPKTALTPKTTPVPKKVRLSPAAADRILEKVDRLTKK